MHLALNATDIGRQRGGNESYLLGLIDGLRSLPENSNWFSVLACREGLPILSQQAWPAHFQIIDMGPWHRWSSYLWQQTRMLRQLKPDWYFSTYLLPPVVPCRAALLVHDLSFRAHPEYFPASIALYMRILVSAAIRRADRIIVDSEFTRGEIKHFHANAPQKTSVVYLGVGREFVAEDDTAADQSALQQYGVQSPYILAMGNIHPRKNLDSLLEAYQQLQRNQVKVPPMVWAGIERWGSSQLQSRARDAGVKLIGRVAAEDLPAVYRQASVLVYPSAYEGFGLPPVEAMACGTPVVASNTTSLPEVLGDAALLVDPMNVNQIAAGIERSLFDQSLRTKLRERGIERSQQFDWIKSAQSLLDILDRFDA
jgi:glycosyltransferase involved in cell wall biosynthesis